jgi:hypothetical protein
MSVSRIVMAMSTYTRVGSGRTVPAAASQPPAAPRSRQPARANRWGEALVITAILSNFEVCGCEQEFPGNPIGWAKIDKINFSTLKNQFS